MLLVLNSHFIVMSFRSVKFTGKTTIPISLILNARSCCTGRTCSELSE